MRSQTPCKTLTHPFSAKEAIPVPQGNLAGLPENKSHHNQEYHAEIAYHKRCSMKLRKCTGMHWLRSASTARPSHPMPRPTRQNHHVTVWESNIDFPTSPQDNSDYEFSKMAGSEFPLILFEFIYSYYRFMFLWLIWLNFKSRVPYKDGMCMLPARRLRRLQYLSGKSLLRLLRRYAWCLKSRLHNYTQVSPWRLYRDPPIIFIHLLPRIFR